MAPSRAIPKGRLTSEEGMRTSLPDCRPITVSRLRSRSTWEAEYESQPLTLDDQVWIVADARVDAREELLAALALPDPIKLEQTPDVELILERLWDFRPAGRSQDGVERRGLGPAARAVAGAQLDVVVAQPLQPRRRQPGQLVDALDGIDALGDPADHRGRIARAGADLEHAIARLDLRRCDHQADDVRLRDGLAGFDRQRGVLIGKLAQAFGNEDLAGHPAHGSEHVAIAYASTRQLSIHHPVSVMG